MNLLYSKNRNSCAVLYLNITNCQTNQQISKDHSNKQHKQQEHYMRRQRILNLRVGAVVVEDVFVLQLARHHHDSLDEAGGKVECRVVAEEDTEGQPKRNEEATVCDEKSREVDGH